MTKRRLLDLVLGKIAVVDRPCQEPALMTIMKRAADDSAFEKLCKRKFTAEERREATANGHAMPGGGYPINDAEDLGNAIDAVGRGKGSHAAIRAHIKRRAKALGATDKIPEDWAKKKLTIWHQKDGSVTIEHDPEPGEKTVEKRTPLDLMLAKIAKDMQPESFSDAMLCQAFWDAWYKGTGALQEAIRGILTDETVTDKAAAIADEIEDFSEYVEDIIPDDIDKSLAASLADDAGAAGPTLLKGELTMNLDALRKKLNLPATTSDADVLKAAAKKAEDDEKEEGEHEKRLAKMSQDHTAYMNHDDAKLPKGGKKAFAAMEPGQRDELIAANPLKESDDDVQKALKSGNAFQTPDGSVMTKRDFGTERGFLFAKAQNAEAIKNKADMAKRDEADAVTTFAKRATDMGQPAEFGVTIRKAYGGDAAAQAQLESTFTALNKQVSEGKLFDNFGSNVAKAGSALAEMNVKRDEVRKAEPKLTTAQAFTKAYTDPANAEIVKRMKVEGTA